MQAAEENGHRDITLLEVVLRLTGDFRKALTALHITPLQAGVILYIHRHAGTGVLSMAKALGTQGPTLTPVVQDLVKIQLVKQRDDPSDRRARRLALTTKGKALVPCILRQIKHIGFYPDITDS